jgi:hypothetical protein
MAPAAKWNEWGEERTDLMLDLILCLELAVLAAVLLMWHPPIHAFPAIFQKP